MNRRTRRTTRLTLCALFAALIAVCSQVIIPLPAVPLSLALLAVHLCGLLLGPRDGAAAVGAYLLLGLLGVPVYAGFSSGPAILFGPTGGFLFGYVLCAAVDGWAARRFGARSLRLLTGMAAGDLLCLLMGTVWLAIVSGVSSPAQLAAMPLSFLPGDAIKIALAALLFRRLRRPLAGMGIH